MVYELQLQSARYPALPDGATKSSDPGRPLAEAIATQLRQRGYRTVTVLDESPLWIIEVALPPERHQITVLLFEPHEVRDKALWIAYMSSKLGFWARWRKKPEHPSVLALAHALEASARAIDGLSVVGREGYWEHAAGPSR